MWLGRAVVWRVPVGVSCPTENWSAFKRRYIVNKGKLRATLAPNYRMSNLSTTARIGLRPQGLWKRHKVTYNTPHNT